MEELIQNLTAWIFDHVEDEEEYRRVLKELGFSDEEIDKTF